MTEDEKRFLFEERAAIIEYCANVPRVEAERMAREIVYGEHSEMKSGGNNGGR